MNIKINNFGQGLLEIILALAIFSLFALSFVVLFLGGSDALMRGDDQLQAQSLASAGLESIRSIRGHAWNELINNSVFLSTSSQRWFLNGGGPEKIGKYSRDILIEDVCRDPLTNFQSDCSTGVLDIQTKKVTSEVSWTMANGVENFIKYSMIISNWGSLNFFEDLDTDFNDGDFTSTTVSVVNGDNNGSIVLNGLGSSCGWDCPLSSSTINIPGNSSAKKIFVQKINTSTTYLYFITGDNLGSVYIYDVSDSNSPFLLGSFSENYTFNDIYVLDNYIFLATDNDNKELVILDSSNPNLISEVGFYDADSRSDGLSIYIYNNYAYLGTDRNRARGSGAELYILNISNPANPALVLSNSFYDVGDGVNDIIVEGSFAYLAVDDRNKELLILDISDPSAVSIEGSYNMLGNNYGFSLLKDGDYLYITNGSGGLLDIIDVSLPSSPVLIGTYSGGAFLNGFDIYEDYLFLSTTQNSNELIILDISNKASPTSIFIFDNSSRGLDVFYFDGHIYFGSEDKDGEVKIFWPFSTGGSGYEISGEYVSSVLDLGEFSRAIQIISWDQDLSMCSGCEILFQIRSGLTLSSINSLPWLGPSGEGTYYTNYLGSIIPVFHNGDRYFQYKVFLSGDGNSTPVLNSVTINYK